LRTRVTMTILLAAAAMGLAACGSSSKSATPSVAKSSGAGTPTGSHTLVGTFMPAPGVCSSATAIPTGSYLEMLGQGGSIVKNSFGGCVNAQYTPLKPGTEGLKTGTYQPSPPNAIFQPASFFGSAFTVNTDQVDRQTNTSVPPPSITSNGGRLTGNMEAIDVAYNGAYFNQGAPKPGGGYPGTTKALSGTISCNGSFTMQWQSLIVGGAFNNFTGVWHLSGTFVPSSGSVASALGC
jgi:ABC-type Fe3+-hydroxamate transport system substrate-binding protein